MQSPNFREYRGTMSVTQAQLEELAQAHNALANAYINQDSQSQLLARLADISETTLLLLLQGPASAAVSIMFSAFGISAGGGLSLLEAERREYELSSVSNGAAMLQELADLVDDLNLYNGIEVEVFFREFTDPQTGNTTRTVHGNPPGGGTDYIILSYFE